MVSLKVRVMEYEEESSEDDGEGSEAPKRDAREHMEAQLADQYEVEDGTRLCARLREYAFVLSPNGGVHSVMRSDACADGTDAPGEFPAVCPRPSSHPRIGRSRCCWINARSDPSAPYLDGVQKIDLERGTAASPVVTFGEGSYGGAPEFVPRVREGGTGEDGYDDDGYLIVMVYRSKEHRSDVIVLDARSMEEVCALELKGHVPFQFHGDWLPGYATFDDEDTKEGD